MLSKINKQVRKCDAHLFYLFGIDVKMNENYDVIRLALRESSYFSEQWNNILDKYVDVQLKEARKLVNYRHAAHAFIWARNANKLWNKYNLNAAVLMQMRFDGCLGFPGGFVFH